MMNFLKTLLNYPQVFRYESEFQLSLQGQPKRFQCKILYLESDLNILQSVSISPD